MLVYAKTLSGDLFEIEINDGKTYDELIDEIKHHLHKMDPEAYPLDLVKVFTFTNKNKRIQHGDILNIFVDDVPIFKKVYSSYIDEVDLFGEIRYEYDFKRAVNIINYIDIDSRRNPETQVYDNLTHEEKEELKLRTRNCIKEGRKKHIKHIKHQNFSITIGFNLNRFYEPYEYDVLVDNPKDMYRTHSGSIDDLKEMLQKQHYVYFEYILFDENEPLSFLGLNFDFGISYTVQQYVNVVFKDFFIDQLVDSIRNEMKHIKKYLRKRRKRSLYKNKKLENDL